MGGGQKASKLTLQNLDTWHPRDPEAVADIIIAVEEITANEKKKKAPKMGTCPDFKKDGKIISETHGTARVKCSPLSMPEKITERRVNI